MNSYLPSFGDWQIFWWILFGLSLPLTALLGWRLISMDRKIQRRKSQIEKDLHFPGMEDIRGFLKHELKKHGIKTDDKHYEKN